MNKIRLIIADDHLLFRDGLRTLIQGASDCELVGEAANGRQAVALIDQHKPDVVLLDIQMPEMNGLEAARVIHKQHPQVNILMLTMFDDDQSVFAAMKVGARGYILKGADHAEMLRAIRAVAQGEAIFSPVIAARLMSYFAIIRPPEQTEAFPELSEREKEILQLVARGMNNGAIADTLTISPKTVRNHVSNVLQKLQVADRAEAIIRAREAGWG